MESFEHMGYWWLPHDATNARKIPGKLSFDPETGGLLELMGDFANPQTDNSVKYYEIIHGEVLVKTRGKYRVTLRNCFVDLRDGIHVVYIYWTSHTCFDNTEDIQFERVVVDYTYLNDWMPHNNFTSNLERHDEKRMLIKYVRYFSGEPIEIQLDNVKIEIVSALSSTEGANEVSLKKLSRFIIIPQEKLHIDRYLQFIDVDLPGFLTFATGHANYPLTVKGQVSDDLGVIRNIYIYYGIQGYTKKKRALRSKELLFSFRDVEVGLPKYLQRWIGNSEKLRTVLDLYFKSYYDRSWYIYSQFLDLARALEAYHRTFHGGQYLSKEDYEPIKKTLIGAIPDCVEKSHRDALIGRLDFGHEFSLRTRLKNVIHVVLEEQSDVVESFLGKPSKFIGQVVDARNRLTHPDGSSDDGSVTLAELRDLIPKTQMLLRICLLVEMDFPPTLITRLLNENQEYLQLTKDE